MNSGNNHNISYEQYVEITVAQTAADQQGKNPQDLLNEFGLTPFDWSQVSAYWSAMMQQDPEKYFTLFSDYEERYKEKYGIVDDDDDDDDFDDDDDDDDDDFDDDDDDFDDDK